MWIKVITSYDPLIVLGTVWVNAAEYRSGDHVSLIVREDPPISVATLLHPDTPTMSTYRTFEVHRFVKGRGWNKQSFLAIVTDHSVEYWREIAGFKEWKK
jgi:hypothetical protein